MAKIKLIDKLKSLYTFDTETNIEQAIMLLQAARSCIDAYTAERAAKQLHIGTLSQMNKDIGMITKKLSGYVEG